MCALLQDIHDNLETIGPDVAMVTGHYDYYHYGCDGLDDRGWGCGYRTLQSLCSWVRRQRIHEGGDPKHVPSIADIQTALVTMQDKPAVFKGSRDWIGSIEVSLCVDFFFDVPCRIVHISPASELENHLDELSQHFSTIGSPLMMGGESDASSKGIMGVCKDPPSLLVVDPHYYGPAVTKEILQKDQWVKWVHVDQFCKESFYNICLPQYKKPP